MLRFATLSAFWLLVGFLILTGCTNTPPSVTVSPDVAELATTSPTGQATPAPSGQPDRPTHEDPREAGATARAVATAQAQATAQPTANSGGDPATPSPTIPPGGVNQQPIPLIDMGSGNYFGFEGGLYPGGVNEMPPEHAEEGLRRAQEIQPLDLLGNPDPSGQAILLSIGMSNTTMEFCRPLGTNSPTDGVTCHEGSFMGLADIDPAVETEDLIIVNGARGGQIADRWDSPDEENYTRIRDALLTPLGLSELQVQVVWLKVTNHTEGSPPSLPDQNADAYRLVATMADVVRTLKVRYPNLQQVFISSRIYAGNATVDINPEPYAYETGFAVKWLIEAQIRQMASGGAREDPKAGNLNYDRVAPWLAWGPYLWADGTNPRSDGLVWLPEDFGDDGTHPSELGRAKVGALLLDFFRSSIFTGCWFLAQSEESECARRVALIDTVDESEITATPELTPEPATTPEPTATPPRGQEAGSDVTLSDEARPLTELGTDTYLGFEGGLYPDGLNEPPPAHAEAGMARMQAIQPLDQQGAASPNGNIVLLSIGMSNTMMEFCGEFVAYTRCESYSLIGKALVDPAVDHTFLDIINGARGSQVASDWVDPSHRNYDRIRDSFLAPFGLSEAQVQVVWLKATDFLQGKPPLPSQNAHAYALTATLADIVRALKVRYPNLQQVFLSSRIYAGYATRDLSPEPYAYETGFSVKWLIEAQIQQMNSGGGEIDSLAGDLNYNTVAPWLAWGPYLWADGATPRESDGLVWLPEDFGEDGTHPLPSGRAKVADLLLNFFKGSPFTSCWFLADADC